MRRFSIMCLGLLLGLMAGCGAKSAAPGVSPAPVTIVTTAEPEETAAEAPAEMTEQLLYGVWQYDGLEQYLVFSEGGWQLYNDAGLYREGLLETADDFTSVALYLLDGTLFPGEDNVITFSCSGTAVTGTDWDGDTLLPSALPDFPPSTADELGLTGVWKYDDYPIWIVIDPGGGWTQYTTDYADYNVTCGSVLYRDPPVLFNTWGRFDMTLTLLTPDAPTAQDADGYTLHRVDALWAE